MPNITRDHKRRGQHHRHSKHYVKVYAPYLPLLISLVGSVLLSFWQPQRGNTLAYATEMSHGGLIAATNTRRSASGIGGLTLSAQLNAAAQAKANDMVARNYWNHNTPDGKQPWVFIKNSGYNYVRAGENLAYGFNTSADTVTGWMNSATHKANMLDSGFTEVGFGFANSANFNGDGKETVVVAMYGRPQVYAATTQTPPSTPAPVPQPESPSASISEAVRRAQAKRRVAAAKSKRSTTAATKPVTTDIPASAVLAQPIEISRAEALIGTQASLLMGVIASLLCAALLMRLLHHGHNLKHLLRGHHHKLALHHPLLDSTLIGLTILGTVLARTVGFIL